MTDDTPSTWYSPHSGNAINPDKPDPSQIDVEDIALGLSNTNRYAGQTVPAINVAQHSMNVAETLDRFGYDTETQMYGLLHDLAEAYLGDVPRPAKKRLDGFEEMEDNILDAAYHEFDLGIPTEQQWSDVMHVDNQNLIYEVENLFDDQQQADEIKDVFRGVWDQSPEEIAEELDDLPLHTEPQQSRQDFVRTFDDIQQALE